MEATNSEIGLVGAAWGVRKMCLQFVGETSHTGPTPMPKRRDALRGAAAAITRFHDGFESQCGGFHFSAARMDIYPESPNVVPSQVKVWFEIRHPSLEATFAPGDAFLSEVRDVVASRGIAVEVLADEKRPATPLDASGIEIVRRAALAAGRKVIDTETIAGHDALALQRIVQSSLIFVPSVGGISHNEREWTEPADLENGVDVLHRALLTMLVED
jgi:N-carbamoyl-L-amino-acid hydrolase